MPTTTRRGTTSSRGTTTRRGATPKKGTTTGESAGASKSTGARTSMQEPLDLFLYEMSCMYDFEQQNVRNLERLAQEVSHEAARRPIQHHLEETREQVRLLDQCFATLAARPRKISVQAVRGLQRDREAFIKRDPNEALRTLYDVGAAAKIEHMEVAAYRGLIDQATHLGQREVVRLLRSILKQEEQAVRELEAATKQLGKELHPGSQRMRAVA